MISADILMARQKSEFSAAMVASALLHVGVIASALVAWPWSRPLPVGGAVPINIVANAPSTNLAPAIEAAEEAPAQTEQPVPDAAPTPAAPEPAPTPTPPAPTPKPAPRPAPTPAPAPAPTPKPAPAKPPTKAAPAKPAPKSPGLDLDALAASVAKSAKSSGSQRSSAAKGETRPATAREARPDLGSGQAAAAIAGMTDELQRRWNPNCEVEGGRDVRIRVTFTLGSGGQVLGQPDAGGKERSANPVEKAAAERAIRAVFAAAPFRDLPRQFYGDRIAVNFNAREACL
ncbi:energy transducer TonB [Phenylobacterium sp.]|uniref:energy transducer TonB n=1 Tax=Phenylobacterium sp. TaxID=1871053 RepID=UPI002729D55D|nr:energy transducer TonB [Phenylobacterium sp.]